MSAFPIPYHLVAAGTTNATNVKASAGKVHYISCSNVNAAVRYLKLYNTAAAPTVGTTVPTHTFLLPISGNFVLSCNPPIDFNVGISFALTTEATDSGNTAVTANEHVVNLGYS